MSDEKKINSKKVRFAQFGQKWFLPTLAFLIIASYLLFFSYTLLLGHFFFGGPNPCDDWKLGMSKEEKFILALEWSNSRPSLDFEMVQSGTGLKFNNKEKQIPYEDAEAILREQSDCCHLYESVSAKSNQPNEKVPDGDEGTVMLRYMAKYKDINGNTGVAPNISYIDFNSCK